MQPVFPFGEEKHNYMRETGLYVDEGVSANNLKNGGLISKGLFLYDLEQVYLYPGKIGIRGIGILLDD